MANCSPLAQINPFNAALLAAFGPNFYPPFNAGFPPIDKKLMINEKLLQMSLPGGGKIKPTGEPYKSINEILTTVMGPLGTMFSTFAPIFLILDLIRAIIDVLCALMNPQPVIDTMVDMFLNVIPPILALFPPLASILLALNAIKLIIAIIVSLLTAIIPLIEQILECGLGIPEYISDGNFAAVDGCAQRICQLLQMFLNEIGALAPIAFIIDLLDFFMNLGSKFFCAAEAECCNPDNCPPLINNPPSGSGTIASVNPGINLEEVTGLDIQLIPAETVISVPSNPEVAQLQRYVVDPSKLNATPQNPDPATFRVRVNGSLVNVANFDVGTITVRSGDFTAGDEVDFEIVPDKAELLKANLIGLGCMDDISAAAASTRAQAETDSGDGNALSSLASRIGLLPRLTELERRLTVAHDTIASDPTVDVTGAVNTAVVDYLSEITEFYEDLVCTGASRTSSQFAASKLYVVADGSDNSQLSLRVNDRNGANLLDAQVPNTDLRVVFHSDLGEVGTAIFDPVDSTFKASISSSEIGIASITASFLTRNEVCMVAGVFNGTAIVDKVLNIEFVTPAGKYPRRRRENQYVQSAGGRRRV